MRVDDAPRAHWRYLDAASLGWGCEMAEAELTGEGRGRLIGGGAGPKNPALRPCAHACPVLVLPLAPWSARWKFRSTSGLAQRASPTPSSV